MSTTARLAVRSLLYGSNLEVRWQRRLSGVEEITALDYDQVTGAILAGYKFAGRCSVKTCILPKDRDDLNVQELGHLLPMSVGAEISSITISPGRTALCTAYGADDHWLQNRLWFNKLVSPEEIAIRGPQHMSPIANTNPIPIDYPMDIWTSASASYLGHDIFAVGTNRGVIPYSTSYPALDLNNPDSPTWKINVGRTASDVLALEFTSPQTILAGQRSGGIDMIDLRSKEQIGHAKFYLRHPGCVTHIRKVDDWHVVVNGFPSSLRMYDLRYPAKSYIEPTPAIVEYHDHDHTYRIHLGFDVDVESGLMAVGRNDKKIQLYTINTGEKVNNSVLSSMPSLFQDYFPRCIRFCYARGEGNLRSMLVSAGATIYEVAS
ncbi:MAG: hypothetical protein M1816_007630 [Peltula sp. TS41687]|nr:MAG: hypothetical protein M1816_007630 [Peltula sp. TS41687]